MHIGSNHTLRPSGIVRTALSVRSTVSQGRVARYNSSQVMGGYQVGFSCQMQRTEQGEGRGGGGIRETVASVIATLGRGEGSGGSGKSGRNPGGGVGIKPSFSSMPALQHGI